MELRYIGDEETRSYYENKTQGVVGVEKKEARKNFEVPDKYRFSPSGAVEFLFDIHFQLL